MPFARSGTHWDFGAKRSIALRCCALTPSSLGPRNIHIATSAPTRFKFDFTAGRTPRYAHIVRCSWLAKVVPTGERRMAKTVADEFAETLAAAGVKRIYGIVGDSLNGLTDAIRRQGKIEWLHVRHEEVAAFAAGAEAHLTGELAVCAGSCGPGNLHLINGLFDCHRSRVPVLAIAAQIPSAESGSGYFQETHPETLFKECSHYCELISTASQMPRVLEVAIREAVGKRGVSVIVISGDVALQAASDAPAPKPAGLMPAAPVVTPAYQELDRLAALLKRGG